ncbi:DUF6538 domain-containing protein [Ferrimonas pelagia]|uniref:DUF6538 domain-containing protein n=1 Tax=Ferrimonas pelagia TaxID=1177826 RepID=UPI003CD0816D
MRVSARSQSPLKPPKAPYLFQSRHGVWYARVAVPKDLRLSVGKTELRKSLKTRCHSEASQCSWNWYERLDESVLIRCDNSLSTCADSGCKRPIQAPLIPHRLHQQRQSYLKSWDPSLRGFVIRYPSIRQQRIGKPL